MFMQKNGGYRYNHVSSGCKVINLFLKGKKVYTICNYYFHFALNTKDETSVRFSEKVKSF